MKSKNALALILWSSLGLLVFFSSMSEQVVVNDNLKEQVKIIFPEGWGFFTKNPRDLLLEVYRIRNNQIIKISMSNQKGSNFFGLSRKSRVIGYEASMIANKIPKDLWKKNNSKKVSHFIGDSIINVSSEKGFKHFINGDYLIKLFRPIPYAWSNKNQEDNRPFSIARIRIQTSDK